MWGVQGGYCFSQEYQTVSKTGPAWPGLHGQSINHVSSSVVKGWVVRNMFFYLGMISCLNKPSVSCFHVPKHLDVIVWHPGCFVSRAFWF